MESLLRTSLVPWMRATRYWLRLGNDIAGSAIPADRGSADAYGGSASVSGAVAGLPSTAGRLDGWRFERSVDSTDDMGVGASVTFEKRLSDADVRAFARASGDTSRLHLDPAFARRSRFGERIVHGTLVVGTISAALARLPGLTIYLSQDVEYLRPVPVEERVTATCTVVEDLGDDRYRLTTVVTDEDDEVVVDGEAVVLVDDLDDG